jgi:membrane protein YdbS with pleckstrin-like domain
MTTSDQNPSDELVIRPSQVINYGAYLFAALQMAIVAGCFAVLRAHWKISPWILAILLAVILANAALTWLKTASASYHFAKSRLTWRAGLLSRTAQSLELYRVADVTMRQPLFQRLFGVGQITIRTADANHREIVIPGVPQPDRFRDWLTDAVQATRRERGMREIQMDQL